MALGLGLTRGCSSVGVAAQLAVNLKAAKITPIDPATLTYFYADQVHWTDALYNEAAVLDAATINALGIS